MSTEKILLTSLIFIAFIGFTNEFHKKISKLNEKERIEFFENYLVKNGDVCDVQETFLQGYNKTDDGYFWNVKCKRGESLALYILPDGNVRILECSILAQLDLNCFEKLED
jgi:hypothetical protein